MATNAASYNPSKNYGLVNKDMDWPEAIIVGEKTGPVTGAPPAVSNDTKTALTDAAESSATGSHVPGQNVAAGAVEGGEKVKSAKDRMGPVLFDMFLDWEF